MMSIEKNGYLELTKLKESSLSNPHQFLGLHQTSSGQVIRIWRPEASYVQIEILGKVKTIKRDNDYGLFEYFLEKPIQKDEYRIFHASGLLGFDPYVQSVRVQEEDALLFAKGVHYNLYSVLGANIEKDGVHFAIWAPRAKSVYFIGDFNQWKANVNPMSRVSRFGIWEIFIPGLFEKEKYKFMIHTREGFIRIKSDPMAFFSELRPKTASICFDVDRYLWQTKDWKRKGLNQPINIYEVHLGSWKKYPKEFANYRELAIDLAKYCNQMGFSHIELLPIMEHPLDESWGYQVTGFFSATSRYGSPRDFQFFVDYMHSRGIGVILDWVPGHFPMDDFSLNRFDGTALYEYEDPRRGIHPHWHTAIFNYKSKEVCNFLIASALFWFDKMRIDGIRVDAVSSILYLDYGREKGQWIPNADGSNINYDSVAFLKHLNAVIHEKFPNALMIAEESTTFSKVTHQEGLGFDLKWNMGWMNDSLHYFSKDPMYRKFHQNDITFSLHYAFDENFVCVLSHDEVVHEKKSILAKMPGPDEHKFANVRLLYSYMLCHPGKNLIFMGAELGQWEEWACKGVLNWKLLEYPLHCGLQQLFQECNFFYRNHPAFWEKDNDSEGFEWVDHLDHKNSVISYLRKGRGETFLCIHHFTPTYRTQYWVQLEKIIHVEECFNTDADRFGGSNRLNKTFQIEKNGFQMNLSPLSTIILKIRE